MSEEERKEAAGQRDNRMRVTRELVEAESEAEVAALINRSEVSATECLFIALEKAEENERGVQSQQLGSARLPEGVGRIGRGVRATRCFVALAVRAAPG